jgi:hypothetical protein
MLRPGETISYLTHERRRRYSEMFNVEMITNLCLRVLWIFNTMSHSYLQQIGFYKQLPQCNFSYLDIYFSEMRLSLLVPHLEWDCTPQTMTQAWLPGECQINPHYVRFQVLTTVTKSSIFWDIALYNLLKVNHCYRECVASIFRIKK